MENKKQKNYRITGAQMEEIMNILSEAPAKYVYVVLEKLWRVIMAYQEIKDDQKVMPKSTENALEI